MQLAFVLAVLAYLSGSVPTGKLLGLRKNIDIQKHGSGNIGFANAVRVLGWRSGVVVLVVDVFKGFAPVFLAHLLGVEGAALLFVGLMPIIGHAFPAWLGFRGGKSIAAGFGVLLALSPLLALCGVAVYCAVFLMWRKSALGSLIGTWSLLVWAGALEPELTFYVLLLALFATYTHRQNIRELAKEYAT